MPVFSVIMELSIASETGLKTTYKELKPTDNAPSIFLGVLV